jgi:hypothetical protein
MAGLLSLLAKEKGAPGAKKPGASPLADAAATDDLGSDAADLAMQDLASALKGSDPKAMAAAFKRAMSACNDTESETAEEVY